MTLYHWSQTAANNGTADITCPVPEGMAASAVNDSARGLMAAVAKYRDDISGQISTANVGNAYTVTSFQVFDSLADMSGKMIAFTPSATNTGACTLNVDTLGAKPLRSAPGVDIPSGVLIVGTPYLAVYNNANGEFYLHGMFGNALCPVGCGFSYYGASAPNSSFAFPIGQQISQTTYAKLYALFGPNKYGADTGGNFFLPDERGKVQAAPDNMGGSAANILTSTYFGATAALGVSGGNDHKTLITQNLPPYTPAGTINVSNGSNLLTEAGSVLVGAGSTYLTPTATNVTATFSGTPQGGTSTPFATIQPTICVNKIIRII